MKAVASSWLRFPASARPKLPIGLPLLSALGIITTAGFLARAQSPPPSSVKVVNLIPASLSGESNQDSEPFLAIQNQNPQVMVASAFTPNPFSMTGNAPVYVSQDSGKTWVLNAITPVQRMTATSRTPWPPARIIRAATCTRARWLVPPPSRSMSPNRTTYR